MKEIVFVTGAMGRGGAERVISILSEKYVELGWKVSILMLLHGNVEYELNPSVEIIDYSNDKKKAILDIPRLAIKVRKFLKKRNPDAVVSFMAQISIVTGIACAGLDINLITSERIDPSMTNRNFLYTKLLNFIYSRCAVTVLQTQRAWNYFPKQVQKNSVIIPNPVRVKVYASDNKDKKIVTAGRLTEQKNHIMLIDAFAEISKKHPEYTLEIYGNGPLEQKLKEHIEFLGLTNKVFLMGNVLNLHDRISTSEIFVLSSDFEGLSNALLEAMMMGLPCISTNCAGSDEAITNMENGILIDTGDKEALIKAMELLISDKDLGKKIGYAAKKSSEYYYVDNVIDEWRKIIEH